MKVSPTKLTLIVTVVGLFVHHSFSNLSWASILDPIPISVASPADDGTALFRSRCVICHGSDGRGKPKWRDRGQPDFTNAEWQKSRKDLELLESIRNGKGKLMPAFKDKISEEGISALVVRVRAFGKKN